MVARKKVRTVREFVERRIDEINFITDDKKSLIDALVRSIEIDEIVCIIGESGTGKDFLLKEIIIPGLEKFRNLCIQKELGITEKIFKGRGTELYEIFNELELSEKARSSQTSDHEEKKLFFITDEELEKRFLNQNDDNITKFYNKVVKGSIIKLPSIQELFLEYPLIIESIIKKLVHKSKEKILIGICGYIESLISGLNGNFNEIRRIIINDQKILSESKYLQNNRIGAFQHFNSFLDRLSSRKKIWKSFWKGPGSKELIYIYRFNNSYKHRPILEADPWAGPQREHPHILSLIRLKEYCVSFLQYFNPGEINPHLWDPIDQKIHEINSGQSTISSLYGRILVFSNMNFAQRENFHIITLRGGKEYFLTDQQALVMKHIYNYCFDGRIFSGKGAVELAGVIGKSLEPTFKSNKDFYKELFIVENKRKGFYKVHKDFVRIHS